MIALPEAIVDSHHHLWDLKNKQISYSWLGADYDASKFFLGEYRAFCQDFLPSNFRASWEGMPVVASVHVEAECDRRHALAETVWLHEQASASGLPNAVAVYVDLLAPDADARLAQQAAYPLVRSVRCKPTTSQRADQSVRGLPGSLQDERWSAGLSLLSKYGLAWDFRVPFWHLEEAAALLRRHPELPVVVEHSGMPWDRSPAGLAVWRRGMAALADCPNVQVKLSELCLRDQPWRLEDNLPIIREAVAIFGWPRCMFGSNFPVTGLRISYPALIQAMAESLAHLSDEAKQAIWCDNAIRFYRIAKLERSDRK